MLTNSIVRIAIISLISVIIFTGCDYNTDENVVPLTSEENEYSKTDSDIHFGIYNELSPLQNYLLYDELIKDFQKVTNLSTSITLRKSYSEIHSLLQDRKLDVAYIYLNESILEDYQENYTIYFTSELQSQMKSIVVVNQNSNINNISDLQNQLFSYTEPNSYNSMAFDQYLEGLGQSKEAFFKNYFYTFYVDESVSVLHSGIVNGVVIDSLNYAILSNHHQESQTKSTDLNFRILLELDSAIKEPVLLMRNDLNDDIKDKVKRYFRHFPDNEKQKTIGTRLHIASFKEEKINDRLINNE
ncbi:hypothetical protein BHU72_07315 [Desulfuribacillus stibiiarsenatis]|uniref:Solute-binding protein family 3/N-terminal domain-containing protein n=1 Tax=Desulfuribacillus stibiiarsenatis TaxID=1390249 RepID=A0A1E5L4H2_9FIRM|nr:PhnD/SsuA/transferrin family substrate-binding protein [Desulfuribacillus stibiiarsenatis]OEH84991.1 hypothetical protein BHU72_07315 [Desulfuribacillus stibiiarsenatis]